VNSSGGSRASRARRPSPSLNGRPSGRRLLAPDDVMTDRARGFRTSSKSRRLRVAMICSTWCRACSRRESESARLAVRVIVSVAYSFACDACMRIRDIALLPPPGLVAKRAASISVLVWRASLGPGNPPRAANTPLQGVVLATWNASSAIPTTEAHGDMTADQRLDRASLPRPPRAPSPGPPRFGRSARVGGSEPSCSRPCRRNPGVFVSTRTRTSRTAPLSIRKGMTKSATEPFVMNLRPLSRSGRLSGRRLVEASAGVRLAQRVTAESFVAAPSGTSTSARRSRSGGR
jgi:hypothetical protein